MGTISEKLTYLNGTKQLLKDKINNLGGDITDETTFREYANQLQNVYDNLPKTEYQEGTEINLGVTIKGKLDYDNGVVGIGQSSQDSTKGYNLFKVIDYTTISSLVANAGGTISKSKDKIVITTTTQSASGAYIYKSFLSNLILNYDATKTYYLSADATFSTTTNFKFGKDSSSFNNYTQGKYHLEESIQDNSIVFYTNGTASTITIENIMFCETANKTYEPYTGGQASPNPSYPQTINSVTGNQDVVVSGKNECNITSATGWLYSSGLPGHEDTSMVVDSFESNKITYHSTTNAYLEVLTNNIQLKPNTKYTITFKRTSTATNNQFFVYDYIQGSGYTINYRDNNTNVYEVTFTTSNNGIVVLGFGFGSTTGSATISEIMLVEGDTAQPYEPYITPTSYQLSLGDIELNAIGNYKDELIYDVDEDKVYKNEKIKKINLAQLVYGYQSESTSPTPRTAVNTYGIGVFVGDWLSNIFVQNSTSSNRIVQLSGESVTYMSIANDITGISGSETEDQKIQKIVSVLSEKNAVLITPKATPTQTEITDTTLINQVKALYNAHSNNGTTIITSNGDLPMIIKVRGLKGE